MGYDFDRFAIDEAPPKSAHYNFDKFAIDDDLDIRKWLKTWYRGKQDVDKIAITPRIKAMYAQAKAEEGGKTIPGIDPLKQTGKDVAGFGSTVLGETLRGAGQTVVDTAMYLGDKAADPFGLRKRMEQAAWDAAQRKKYGPRPKDWTGGISPAKPKTGMEKARADVQEVIGKVADKFTNEWGIDEERHPAVAKLAKGMGGAIGGLPGYLYPGGIIITPTIEAIKRSEDEGLDFPEASKEVLKTAVSSALTDMVFRGIHSYPRSMKVSVGGKERTLDLRGLKRIATGFGFATTNEMNKAIESGELKKPDLQEAVQHFVTGLLLPGHKDRELEAKKYSKEYEKAVRKARDKITKADADDIRRLIAEKMKAKPEPAQEAFDEGAKRITLGEPEETAPEGQRQRLELPMVTPEDAVAQIVEAVKPVVLEIKAKRVVAKRAKPEKKVAPKPEKKAAEPEKSEGHIRFFNDDAGNTYELYREKDGQIYRAPITAVFDPKTKNRLGRWEGYPGREQQVLEGLGLSGKQLELPLEEPKPAGPARKTIEQIAKEEFQNIKTLLASKNPEERRHGLMLELKRRRWKLGKTKDVADQKRELKSEEDSVRRMKPEEIMKYRIAGDAFKAEEQSRRQKANEVLSVLRELSGPESEFKPGTPERDAITSALRLTIDAEKRPDNSRLAKRLDELHDQYVKKIAPPAKEPKKEPPKTEEELFAAFDRLVAEPTEAELLRNEQRAREAIGKPPEPSRQLKAKIDAYNEMSSVKIIRRFVKRNRLNEKVLDKFVERAVRSDASLDFDGLYLALAKNNPKRAQILRVKLDKQLMPFFDPEGKDVLLNAGPNMQQAFKDLWAHLTKPKPPTKPVYGGWEPDDPAVKERYDAAVVGKERLAKKIEKGFVELRHKATRRFKDLPNTPEFRQAEVDLRNMFRQRTPAIENAASILKQLTEKQTPETHNYYMWKIIMDDLAWSAKNGKFGGELGFTPASLARNKASLEAYLRQNHPEVLQDVARRQRFWEWIRDEYVSTYKAIGRDVEDSFKNPNYFRHLVIDRAQEDYTRVGRGKKMSNPKERWLFSREGTELDISRDYFETEGQVIAEMFYNIATARIVKNVKDSYDVMGEAKNFARKHGISVEEAVNIYRERGYELWQPDKGNVFFEAMAIPERIAKLLRQSPNTKIKVAAEDVKAVIAKGAKKSEWLVKKELAATLDELTKLKGEESNINRALSEAVGAWKIWTLISPRKFFKYNVRNLSGDLDGTITGNPRALLKVGRAIKDLIQYQKDGIMTQELKEFFNFGGMSSTLQAQEMGELRALDKFANIRLAEKTGTKNPLKWAWRKYWGGARASTDFRESILRYANYIEYKEQMARNNGTPRNFGASNRESIMKLRSIEERAFELQNDLLGAYDRVSVLGQGLRKYAYPFWSWKEANLRRYSGLIRNVVNSEKIPSAFAARVLGISGRTLAKLSPLMVRKAGQFALRFMALDAALQLYNNLFHYDDEKELPRDVRNKPHINLGRGEDGKVQYFGRLGASFDVLEWFGIDALPHEIANVSAVLLGKKTVKEAMQDMIRDVEEVSAVDVAKSMANVMAAGTAPHFKLAAEGFTRRNLYPDIFKPSTIRDFGQHTARTFGLEDEYKEFFGKPTRGLLKSFKSVFVYEIDPGQAAFGEMYDIKNRWLKSKGEDRDGYMLTARGNALYNYKLSLRYGDKKAEKYYLDRYMKMGGTQAGIDQSLRSMHPLAFLSKSQQTEFLESLNEDELDTYTRAIDFYERVILGSHVFSSGRKPKPIRWR